MAQEQQITRKPKFDAAHLLANSAVASVGAGAAMIASTGMVIPAIAAAVAGGAVAYTVTNQIPKNND